MTEHTAVDDVVALLSAPDMLTLAASSPAVRASLQGMLNQVLEEIAVLTSLQPPAATAESRTLGRSVRGRHVIVVLLQEILQTHCTMPG